MMIGERERWRCGKEVKIDLELKSESEVQSESFLSETREGVGGIGEEAVLAESQSESFESK
jgi:hypothetical protein